MRILKSFKFMIPAITVVFVLIINILNAAIVITTVKNHAMSEALEKNTIISEAISNKISLYMHNAVKIVLASTKEINKHPRDFGKLVGEIDRLYVNYAQFDLVFFHDKNGKLLYSNPINPQATQDYTYTDRDYFQQVIQKGDVYISRLYISRVLKVPHFVVAAPILDENNKVLGVLGAGISLVNVYNVARDSKKPFQGGIRIIDSAGALMVDPDRNLNNEVVLADDFKININDETTTLYELLGRQKEGI
ncbi:MAG: hypothetical protein LBP78_00735, partial [Acidaminococcales bacterium]|nr:hypothetical protein [Acidaminococcales bacterium]